MSNEYYDQSGTPGTGAPGSSQTMRNEFGSVERGFDLLPQLAGNQNNYVVVNPSGNALTSAPIPAGPGSSKVKSIFVTNAAGTVSTAYTGVGFKSSSLIFVSLNMASGNAVSVGFVDSSVTNSGQSLAVGPESLSGAWVVNLPVGPSLTYVGTVTSLDADGFTIAWSGTATPLTTANVLVLCLK